MRLNRSMIFLCVTLAVSFGYLLTAFGLGAPIVDGGLTPSFFPILVGGAAIIFAAVLIAQNIRTERAQTTAQTPVQTNDAEPARYTHLWVVAAIFVYIIAFRPIGYFTSSTLFVLAMIVIFSSFEKVLIKAAISVAIVVIAYVMFQQLFGVRLPTLWG